MNKKYISLFLVLVLAVSIFAGCNAKSEAPQTLPAGEQQGAADFQYMTADELKTIVTEGKSDYVVFDVRKKADYDTEHIKGSVSADVDSIVSNNDNAPAKANVEKALSEIDSKDKKFVLLCYSGKRYAEAATGLLRDAGIDAANIYTLEGGYKGWTFADLLEKPKQEEPKQEAAADFQYMTADELKTIVSEGNSDYIVFDVRKQADYDKEHIKGSISADVDSIVSNKDNAPAKANVEKELSEIDSKDKKFVLLCYSGKRYAEAATGLLKDAGIDAANIYTLEGGYKGWTFSDLLEK